MRSLSILILCIALFSCKGKPAFHKPIDSLDAAREFIDGCLKGDFVRADFYMLHDEENAHLLKDAEKSFKAKSETEQQQFATASIQDLVIEDVTRTETIVNYKNSYDKVGRKVKVVLVDGKWQVDFKYTFNGNL
jgi:hypothetical protein